MNMLIFSTSDKGGTGRSVTSCNVAYRRAAQGDDVAYLDFDFGSPTAGAIFDIPAAERGVVSRGLHSCLREGTAAVRLEVATESVQEGLRDMPPNSGRLVLLPGDRSGGEFGRSPDLVRNCAELFLSLEEEYAVSVIDLSAGRSYAIDLVLETMARREMRAVTARWLVFHRWTRQHIIAANGLVFGERGMIDTGKVHGHDPDRLRESIRFVRTAVVDIDSPQPAVGRPAQEAWLRVCNRDLKELAARNSLGLSALLGEVPLDPVLQWREQIISDKDVMVSRIANQATVDAFVRIAQRLSAASAWEVQ
jgi:hypothetical protein